MRGIQKLKALEEAGFRVYVDSGVFLTGEELERITQERGVVIKDGDNILVRVDGSTRKLDVFTVIPYGNGESKKIYGRGGLPRNEQEHVVCEQARREEE